MLRLTKIWRLAEGRRSIGEAAGRGGWAPKDGLMVPITIGVPVYNGADLLDECLACLARQTFRDFEVLIFDNASTDATAEIARGWAARDDRFRHVLRPNHVSAVVNFRDVLLASNSPWFMWRADDDLSADDYVEKLYRVATNSAGCKLAVSNVVSLDLDGGRRKVTPAPEMAGAQTMSDRLRALFAYHVSWFYGLWDRETLKSAFLPLCERYPFAFAADNLALYGPIVDGAVRSTIETEFVQRVRRTAATPRRQTRTPFALMLETRRAFRRELVRMRSERSLSWPFRAALVASEPLYLERAAVPLLKMARTGLREIIGISRPRGDNRYFERSR